MTRSSATEGAAISALENCSAVHSFFPCGMFGKRGKDYIS